MILVNYNKLTNIIINILDKYDIKTNMSLSSHIERNDNKNILSSYNNIKHHLKSLIVFNLNTVQVGAKNNLKRMSNYASGKITNISDMVNTITSKLKNTEYIDYNLDSHEQNLNNESKNNIAYNNIINNEEENKIVKIRNINNKNASRLLRGSTNVYEESKIKDSDFVYDITSNLDSNINSCDILVLIDLKIILNQTNYVQNLNSEIIKNILSYYKNNNYDNTNGIQNVYIFFYSDEFIDNKIEILSGNYVSIETYILNRINFLNKIQFNDKLLFGYDKGEIDAINYCFDKIDFTKLNSFKDKAFIVFHYCNNYESQEDLYDQKELSDSLREINNLKYELICFNNSYNEKLEMILSDKINIDICLLDNK